VDDRASLFRYYRHYSTLLFSKTDYLIVLANDQACLSSVYTGDKTLNVVAVASDGDLKRWEDFY
jgi:hypothetical protein